MNPDEQKQEFKSFFEALERERKPEKVLNGLIEIYENDFMGGYEREDKRELQVIFLELIMYVTRYVNDYRYCSKIGCPCSPESHIKNMVNQYEKEIFGKLLHGKYGLSEVPLPEQREFLRSFTNA